MKNFGLKIGFHVSISGSIINAILNAEDLNCTAFQIFSRNPRGWNAKPLEGEDIQSFKKMIDESYIDKRFVMVHMPYLPNLASPYEESYYKSKSTLYEEITRCSLLGISSIVLHLGSHLGSGKQNGINQIVKACNYATDTFKSAYKRHVALNIIVENSSGQKNSIGSKFEEIRVLLDQLNDKKYAVCLDTCHAFAAGYDLRTAEEVSNVFKKFDDIIGIRNLKVLHLNDSKGQLNENKDRHEHIGLGSIGKQGMKEILKIKYLRQIPIIMETPIDDIRGNKDNMKAVVELFNN